MQIYNQTCKKEIVDEGVFSKILELVAVLYFLQFSVKRISLTN